MALIICAVILSWMGDTIMGKKMIQFIKNLWIKWKYRKYFRSMETQSEYYDQLARSLNKVYEDK